jgi:(p)ppGpp synthase/HD superfamily hydrolase
MQLRVQFRPMAKEIEAKLESMVASAEAIERDFLARVSAALSAANADRVREAHALFLELVGARSSKDGYAAHATRIASFVVSFQAPPDPETIRIALLHNVFEVCDASPRLLEERGVTAREIDAIRRMTIDRAHESDPAYLMGFYGHIEAFGPDLSLVRCIDKLDNLLGIQVTDTGPVFRSYIALAKQFVGPMATRLDATLGAFFDEVCNFMGSRLERAT